MRFFEFSILLMDGSLVGSVALFDHQNLILSRHQVSSSIGFAEYLCGFSQIGVYLQFLMLLQFSFAKKETRCSRMEVIACIC